MATIPSDERKSSSEVLSRLSEFADLASKLAPVGRVRELYQRVRHSSEGFRLDNLLTEMRIELCMNPTDLSLIPAVGPVVVVANHPFGVLDGLVLVDLRQRSQRCWSGTWAAKA